MKNFLLILIFFLICSPVFSLTWDQALSLAGKNSNELKSGQKQVAQAEWTWRKSYAAFMPQISASASAGSSSSSSVASNSSSYGLSASQTLFNGLENFYDHQSASNRLEYQKTNYKITQANFFYNVRSAFLDLLIAQEKIRLLEKILSQRKESTRLIQLRYDSGREYKGNLMTTQADEAQAAYDLGSAKRELKLAQIKISQLLNEKIELAEETIQLKNFEEINIEEAVKITPGYLTAKKQLELAQINEKASLSGFFPDISLSGSLSKRGTDWPPTTSSKSWSLNFSLPLFSGGSRVADTAMAKLALEQAGEDFNLAVKNLVFDLAQASKNYQDARDAENVAQVSLKASEERALETNSRFLNGLTTYDEWSRLQSIYIQDQKNLLNARKSVLAAEAFWYKTLGQLF